MSPAENDAAPPLADELATLLRPAGSGVYLVSTGLAAQRRAQRAFYGARDDDEVAAAFRAQLARAATARVVLLAVPSDVGAGFRRGANLGPSALREALVAQVGDYPRWCAARGVVDLGDVLAVPQLLHDEMLSDAQRERTARALYPRLDEAARRALPVSPLSIAEAALRAVLRTNPAARIVLLGGDHSIAWPAVAALHAARGATLGVVQLDAHTDLLEERLGVRLCFATWAYHANELLGRDGRLVQLGLRASRYDRGHWERALGVRQFWADECNARPDAVLDAVVAQLEARGVREVYLSNDVDGTDPSAIDATGTPEPGGLDPRFVRALLARLAERFALAGGDVCELAPPLARSPASAAASAATAALYLRETLEAAARAAPTTP